MEHSFKVRKEEKEEKTNDVMNHEIDLYCEDGDIGLYCHTHHMYLVGITENRGIIVFDDSCVCGVGTVVDMDDSFANRGDE